MQQSSSSLSLSPSTSTVLLIDRLRSRQEAALAARRATPPDEWLQQQIDHHFARLVGMAEMAADRGEGMSSRYWLGDIPRVVAQGVLERAKREGVRAFLHERHTPIHRLGDRVVPACTSFTISILWDADPLAVFQWTAAMSAEEARDERQRERYDERLQRSWHSERRRTPSPPPPPPSPPAPSLSSSANISVWSRYANPTTVATIDADADNENAERQHRAERRAGWSRERD